VRIKTHDFDFVKKEQEKVVEDIISKRNELLPEGDDTLKEFPYQLKYHAINTFFKDSNMNMEAMLRDLGYETRGDSNMYCPFHDDESGGKPSAKYHSDSDTVYCFSESKLYTSFHVIKDLMGKNPDVIFRKIWRELSEGVRVTLLAKYGENATLEIQENIPSVWKDLSLVLSQFKLQKVSFPQHKIALSKILHKIYEVRAEEFTQKYKKFSTGADSL
jgi:hypothetical protein